MQSVQQSIFQQKSELKAEGRNLHPSTANVAWDKITLDTNQKRLMSQEN